MNLFPVFDLEVIHVFNWLVIYLLDLAPLLIFGSGDLVSSCENVGFGGSGAHPFMVLVKKRLFNHILLIFFFLISLSEY